MKSGAKSKWISFLMLLSELLIIAFVAYWLSGQYRKEKTDLKKNLVMLYKQSYDSVLDSLIIDYIIEPAIADSTGLARYSFTENNTVHKGVKDEPGFDTIRIRQDSIKQNRTVEIRLSTTDSTRIFQRQRTGDSQGDNDEMLIRGVKAFMTFSSDSGMLHRNYLRRVSDGQDSVFFVKKYSEILSDNDLNLDLQWIGSGQIQKDSLTDKGRIVIGSYWDSVPAAVFSQNVFFIIKRILPQILFALVLVLLTGMAFLLAYRNIRKQQRLNEIRNSFISNISHELKTPVSTVKVALESLKKYGGTKDFDSEDYLNMAGKEISRLESLITRVLDLSVVEEDAGILHFEVLDLAEVVRGVEQSIRSRILEAGAELILSGEDKLPVKGDKVYLQSVVMNILDNCLKYAGKGPEILIEMSAEADSAILRISDNGPGIPRVYREKIFEKFFRVPDSDRHNVKGYGLGLSFAKQIIQIHKGIIRALNTDRGSLFEIKLPIYKS